MNVAINRIGGLTLPQLPSTLFESAKSWGVNFFPVRIQTIYDAQGVPTSLDIEWSNDEDAFFQPKAGQTILHVPPLDRFDEYDSDAMAEVRKFLSHEQAPAGTLWDGCASFPALYQIYQNVVQEAHIEAQNMARGVGFDSDRIHELAKKLTSDSSEMKDFLTADFMAIYHTDKLNVISALRHFFMVAGNLMGSSSINSPDAMALLHDVAFALRFIEGEKLLSQDINEDPWTHWSYVPRMVMRSWRNAMPSRPDIYDIIRIYKAFSAISDAYRASNTNTWGHFYWLGALEFLERYGVLYNTTDANIRLSLSYMLKAEGEQEFVEDKDFPELDDSEKDRLEWIVRDPDILGLAIEPRAKIVLTYLTSAREYLDNAIELWPDSPHHSQQSLSELTAYRERVDKLIAEIKPA